MHYVEEDEAPSTSDSDRADVMLEYEAIEELSSDYVSASSQPGPAETASTPKEQPFAKVFVMPIQNLTREQRIRQECSCWEYKDRKQRTIRANMIQLDQVRRNRDYSIHPDDLEVFSNPSLAKARPKLYADMCQDGQGLKLSLPFISSPYAMDIDTNSPYAAFLKEGIAQYRTPNNLLEYEEVVNKIREGNRPNRAGLSKLTIEDMIARNADKLLFESFENLQLELSFIGDMETYPMMLKKRDHDTLLRPVILDSVGVTMLYHKATKVQLKRYGNTKKFEANMRLMLRPIIQITIFYLCLGHKVTVAVPNFYNPKEWKEKEKRVDNVVAFEHLIRSGIVKFLADHSTEIWNPCLRFHADELDGLLVSNAFYVRVLSSEIQNGEMSKTDDGLRISKSSDRLVTPTFVGPTRIPMICHDFSTNLDASEKLDLKKYRGNIVEKRANNKRYYWIKEGVVRSYHEDTKVDYAVRLNNQLTLEDQQFQLQLLENLYELPLRLRRAYQATKYIVDYALKLTELQAGAEETQEKLIDVS